jgi:hypothetical protein
MVTAIPLLLLCALLALTGASLFNDVISSTKFRSHESGGQLLMLILEGCGRNRSRNNERQYNRICGSSEKNHQETSFKTASPGFQTRSISFKKQLFAFKRQLMFGK